MTESKDSAPSGIALFDLDGTLFAWDSQILFRHFVLRREAWRGVFLPVFLLFLPLAGLLGDGGMKRVFLCYLWQMDPERLRELSQEFAASLLPTIYPELHVLLERHRVSGHYLILASASPEFYVKEIGELLGFDLTLGTQVELAGFFPDLENHKGEAKVSRLHRVLPTGFFKNGKLYRSHGYTDSSADLPMLALCDSATVVNPSATLTTRASSEQWEILRPARPWRSRGGFIVRLLALLSGLGEDPGGLKARLGKNLASPPGKDRA